MASQDRPRSGWKRLLLTRKRHKRREASNASWHMLSHECLPQAKNRPVQPAVRQARVQMKDPTSSPNLASDLRCFT